MLILGPKMIISLILSIQRIFLENLKLSVSTNFKFLPLVTVSKRSSEQI